MNEGPYFLTFTMFHQALYVENHSWLLKDGRAYVNNVLQLVVIVCVYLMDGGLDKAQVHTELWEYHHPKCGIPCPTKLQ